MKTTFGLLLFAASLFAAQPIETRALVTQVNPDAPSVPSVPTSVGGAAIFRFEVSFTPAQSDTAEMYQVSLEYTDFEGVGHSETRTAERAEKVSILFSPKPFLMGTVKITPLVKGDSALIPVFNTGLMNYR